MLTVFVILIGVIGWGVTVNGEKNSVRKFFTMIFGWAIMWALLYGGSWVSFQIEQLPYPKYEDFSEYLKEDESEVINYSLMGIWQAILVVIAFFSFLNSDGD
jgi:hypothetical protein